MKILSQRLHHNRLIFVDNDNIPWIAPFFESSNDQAAIASEQIQLKDSVPSHDAVIHAARKILSG
jgi:hypothetical protein